ncbi:hypothetical protein EGR_10783 [Echinococcus granulosus]|uniref:Uncharacterized protein n=1 Tax=Echinococcus granulosus TaxID=6210 RepID=W6U1G4_ECHGR|nr:hypothetical protein EGR_10783 [Echinococcus granulosus]EUB54361.1 hypothetical protein EGR_10783 [Echinococcus granulosus]
MEALNLEDNMQVANLTIQMPLIDLTSQSDYLDLVSYRLSFANSFIIPWHFENKSDSLQYVYDKHIIKTPTRLIIKSLLYLSQTCCFAAEHLQSVVVQYAACLEQLIIIQMNKQPISEDVEKMCLSG